jgi:hypothetical protein
LARLAGWCTVETAEFGARGGSGLLKGLFEVEHVSVHGGASDYGEGGLSGAPDADEDD